MVVRVNTEKPLIASLVGLTALAWLSLFAWGLSPYARYLSHESLEGLKLQDSPPVLAVMVAGWTLMLVAMMLPTSLPLIALFHRIAAQRPNRTLLVVLLVIGYLIIWMAFGLLVHMADLGLHTLADRIAWLDNHALISSATLIAAGIFQFTPLKYKCLDKCRSPMSFVMERWRGSRQEWHSFLLGINHGIFCIGCCWALMLLMFGVGMGSLAWMFLLGAVMAVEKNMPWGRRLSVPLGVILLSVGIPLLGQALFVA